MQLFDKQRNTGGGKSIHPYWKEFVLGEEFSIQATNSGIDKNKLNQKDGVFPYITRSDINNGMDMFVVEQSLRYKADYGNVITIGLDTQTVFYQPTAFYTGQNIQIIRHKNLDKYNALFLVVSIKKLVEKFSWGSYGATLTRLRKSRIYLPATDSGEIDFDFMSNFMKEVETDILNTTLCKFKERLQDNSSRGGVKPTDRQYLKFNLTDIFTIVDGYYNKKPPMCESGTIPFLGATQYNNGVTGFSTLNHINKWDKLGNASQQDCDKRIFKGGCIAITNNGSVGNAYYQKADFTCSHDITPIYLKDYSLTRHIALYLIPLLEKSGTSFEYAKKWRPKRMRKSKIMLPVDANGSPDWDYMEQQAREQESSLIMKYLKSKLNDFSVND